MSSSPPLMQEIKQICEEIFKLKRQIHFSTKNYPNLNCDAEAPETEEEREAATADFYKWMNDVTTFLEKDAPLLNELYDRAIINGTPEVPAKEKFTGDAIISLLNTLESYFFKMSILIGHVGELNALLLPLFSQAAQLLRRHIEVMNKLEDGKITKETFKKFNFCEDESNFDGKYTQRLFQFIAELEAIKIKVPDMNMDNF